MKKNIKKMLATTLLGLGLLAVSNGVDVKAESNEETGSVFVVYMNEYGNMISGKATGSNDESVGAMGVADELSVPVGSQYDTTDHKPTTITTDNGEVWYLVDYEYANGVLEVVNGVNPLFSPEKGTVKSGTTTVAYVYSKTKGKLDNSVGDNNTTSKTEKPVVTQTYKKRLRLPAGNNGVKTRVPVHQTKKSEVKKLRVPAGNNGAKTRVPVKKHQQVENKKIVEAIPNNQL